MYTKVLDKSTLSKDQVDRAERLAKEIEGTMSRNIHVQEERGQVAEQDADWDEEETAGESRDLWEGGGADKPPAAPYLDRRYSC